MVSTRVLGSPIQLSLPEANGRAANPETPTGSIEPLEFVKHGNPFTMDRLFVGLEPAWGGVDAIEFTEDMPVSFVTRVNRSQHDIPLHSLRETSHKHLFNLKEVFVTEQSLFLFYPEWEGISLKEIQTLRPIFQLGEVEVATVCYQIFQGLRYIHDTLNISHGNIREENIYIHKNGDVKIARIGESMGRELNDEERSRDIMATLQIVRKLLGLQLNTGGRGIMELLAHDFTGAPQDTTIDQLLQYHG